MAKPKPKAKAAKIKSKTKAKPKSKTKNSKASPALPLALQKRLGALAKQMNKSMAALTLQALNEFADTWEDHYRTVRELQDDDRIQLSVKPE